MKYEEGQGRAGLAADDMELFSYLLEEEGIESPSPSGVVPRKSTDEPQLSFEQQRLWFIDQFKPGQPTYNIPFALRLTGELDVSVLEHTLHEIIRRHEVLRTTFAASPDGIPLQVIAAAAPFALPITDLRHLPPAEREAEALRQATEEAQRPFDLKHGPLLRVSLLRLREAEHVALVTLHHIVSDGWSTGVFIREVAALYGAYGEGRESPLPELAVQYADYAMWQREWLDGEVLAEQLEYWRGQLGGELPVLDLPTDRPRPPVQSFKGGRRTFAVGAEVRERLQELGRAEGATLFMTLLAAFKTLLYRHATGAAEVTVGTPVAGRNRAEVEDLIGFFVNTLVLRTEMAGEPSFRELLRRVRGVALAAYAHQELPFQKLVEILRPERDLSHTPLFQTWFVLQRAPPEALKLPGLSFAPMDIDSGIAQFDLSLDITESTQGLSGLFMYNRDLFDDETIGRLIQNFQTLLEQVVAHPDQRISQLPLLSPNEIHKLLKEWNDTRSDVAADRGVHELFQQQAETTPRNIALVYGTEQITYEELNRRSNQLANYLRQLGVGPETLVGICVKRSVEMVVGILGILKAGGAYVPLDPTYPIEHLAFMLQDTQLPVLLTQEELEEKIPSNWAQVIRLDADWDDISRQPDTNPAGDAAGNNLAYVIYTSGSTGKPKGAMIAHRNLVNYLNWCVRAYDVTKGKGVPLHSSFAFDLTITSLFSPLITGQGIILVKEEEGVEGLGRALLSNEEYSLVKITPAHLEILKQMLPERKAGGRTNAFVIGGEALMWQSLSHWQQHAPATRLINEYGPTETVVGCCVYEAGAEVHTSGGVPIGRPIANTQLYILDEQKSPVLIGARGELYIGGSGVGRGYLNRPEQTAEKFIPDPFGEEAGARLYRTGDLARYLPDGNIEFLGRLDHQVKVRGFRIELGEIEATLAEHPQVRESAVALREDAPGDKRLVGYVVTNPSGEVTAPELLRYLKGKLPDYEVPSALILLDELPLTVNGKVDVGALPAPAPVRPDMEKEFVAPRTEVEKALAAAWSEVLRVEKVGIHDNFFDLGGHSLLVVQVISRIRDAFQLEMAVRDMFDAPTIAGLAESVERALRAGRSHNAAPIRRSPRDVPPPISFAQQRLWFVHQLDPLSPAYNIPAALRMVGQLNVTALKQAFSEIARRHESLRTSFDIIEGQVVQIIHPAQPVEFPLIDLRDVPEAEREAEALRQATEEAQRPFDLKHGPLLRVSLLRLREAEHVALVTLHHIVSDGWSTGVFIREVAALYGAYGEGRESPLPELAVQYADYAMWQREWLDGEVLAEQLEYWRGQLGGELPVLDLPTDRPRPPVQSFKGGRRTFAVGAEVRERLQELGRAEGATLFMTLLAAFKTLLYRHATGAAEVTVGTPVAGRNRAEVEDLIGFFVNTLVLRTEMAGEPSFRELLRRVRGVALAAYAHQDLPFEKLVEELQPVRDLSRTPLTQVLFTLENPQHEALTLTDLTLTPLGSDSGTVKYDLLLNMADTGDELRGTLDYNVDLFDAGTITRLVEHFLTLLHGIGETPEERIDRLPLLAEAESHQLLVEWNDTKADYHSLECIHQLFKRQVGRSPDAVAVVFEHEQLTYAELNRRANQLARQLREMGVGPEVRVGLCVERSLEMVVGLLGILKAGGAYVPLDPAYPRERLVFMLADSDVPVLLTQRHLLGSLPPHRAALLCVDSDWPLVALHSAEDFHSPATLDNLAYVIYTSGSTGQPKGSMITHRGIINRLLWMQEAYSLTAADTVLQKTPFSFDVSVWEFFWPLLVGARLVLAVPGGHQDSAYLVRTVREQQVTTLHFVPSMLQVFLAAEGVERCESLRRVICSGEALSTELQQQFFERVEAELHNLYGPTEASVDVTYWECARDDARTSVPIGRPIANTQIYILDGQFQPVPVGVAGELYIGGEGLARGYLGRADMTGERFVPHPFSPEGGARLYRTGDQARRRPGGEIDFLGRLDQQVKLRGFRIELGEIEAVLNEYPLVRESILMAREDVPGDKRLVAYVSAGPPQPTAAQLRTHLKTKLPEYMVPSAFVMLEALPLTANGKVDRRSLPAPDNEGRESAPTFVGPRSGSEKEIAAIWEEVLRVENVGVDDNFFDLGGHSLLMIQVRSKLEEKFQRKVGVADLFKYPTVNALAKYLDQRPGDIASDTPNPKRERTRQTGVSQQRQSRREHRARKNEGGANE